MRRRGLAVILCFCICSLLMADLSVTAAEVEDPAVEKIQDEQDKQEDPEAPAEPEEQNEPEIPEEQANVPEQTETEEDPAAEDAPLGSLEYSMEGRELTSVDEYGNVFIVEDQSDGVIDEIAVHDRANDGLKIVNFRANAAGKTVTTTTEYTEFRTGAIGYTYGKSGADAAYLGTENGKVKFMLSGVVGLVDASKVQVVNFSSAKSFSNYYANGTRILHRLCTDMTTPGYAGTVDVGPQQSYMSTGATYYSYDGHYFYTDYETMISDYKNETRSNSINPDEPYYNYFQYLPLRGKSMYTASELKAMVNKKASSGGSKMYNSGDLFVNNQDKYGVNALLMAGVGAHESAWGTSSIAKNKNNLFGLNAVDSSPGSSANSFPDVNTCIKDFAETYMSKRYLRAGYRYYNGGFCGDKASGINVRYASDPYWGEKTASIAWVLDNNSTGKDQNYYTIGIKDRMATEHTAVNVRKDASTSSQILYNTGSVSNYAFLILEESEGFYKVQSDPVLTGNRTQINSDDGTYDSSSMYAYVSKDYVYPVSGKEPQQPMLTYSAHVQTYGWQDYVSAGDIAGTFGESKRVEAIKIKLNNPEYSGSVQYRSHVQTYGWQDWKTDDELCGTSGEAKRLEAMQIRLTGEMAENYDIYYRVHAQTYGWLDWAKNGEMAGASDAAKRLEAIQIQLVKKGDAAPGDTGRPFVQPLIQYRTHVQTHGWQDYIMGGGSSGTTGSAKRLEAIEINLNNQKYDGDIKYKVHVQSYGWQDWVVGDSTAGTSGQSKRLEAIQIKLTDEMEKQYDIYYRVHAQTYGWLGWAKNGEPAGTEGLSKRLEAIQIIMVSKGGEAPGSTENALIKD
jgi:uncharacterized protein YjdB/beta-N-acetylglucosaminidase